MQHPTQTSEHPEAGSRQNQPEPPPSVTLATQRALAAPLGALRVLLEGARHGSGATPTKPFIDRALESLLRAENAAQDLVAWTAPRPLRASSASMGEIMDSVSSTISPNMRRRCHFVIDSADTALRTDARLLVETFARSIRGRLDQLTKGPLCEIMVHAHADAAWATFSFIDAPDEATASGPNGERPELELAVEDSRCLADALMRRDIDRLGGRTSIHETGGHRCCVVVVPLLLPEGTA